MPLVEGYNKLKSKAEQIVESVKTSRFLSRKKEVSLPHAYPCENYTDSILSNRLVRKTLQLFAAKYCKEQIQNIKSTGQLVHSSNYPRLYDVLQSCYKTLNVEDVPEVYITNQLKGINALSVGTDTSPIILISRKAVISLSDGELKFMIGHELGHIIQGNMVCHTAGGLLHNLKDNVLFIGPMIVDIIESPLKEWCRNSEFTADQIGLRCCQEMTYVYSLMEKVKRGERKSIAPQLTELYKGHPFIDSRIEMLEKHNG